MDPSQIVSQILAAAGGSAAQIPAELDFSLGKIISAIIILLVMYFAANLVRRLLARTLKNSRIDSRTRTLLLQVSFYGIIALGVVWVLGGFGLSVVLIGIAVGFALKDIIQNFAAGLLIMGTSPFQPGDWIVVSGNEGRVSQVGWRGTVLDTFDGRRVIVPNSHIITTVVTNNSLKAQLRSTLKLSVGLESDFDRVQGLILHALKGIQGISGDPAPSVMIDTLTGNVMNLNVWIWITDPVNRQKPVVSHALGAIKAALTSADISMQPTETPVIAKPNGSGE